MPYRLTSHGLIPFTIQNYTYPAGQPPSTTTSTRRPKPCSLSSSSSRCTATSGASSGMSELGDEATTWHTGHQLGSHCAEKRTSPGRCLPHDQRRRFVFTNGGPKSHLICILFGGGGGKWAVDARDRRPRVQCSNDGNRRMIDALSCRDSSWLPRPGSLRSDAEISHSTLLQPRLWTFPDAGYPGGTPRVCVSVSEARRSRVSKRSASALKCQDFSLSLSRALASDGPDPNLSLSLSASQSPLSCAISARRRETETDRDVVCVLSSG